MLSINSVGELQTASDNRQYFAVEFSAGLGQKRAVRLFWEQFKRDAKTGLPTSEKYWERGTREQALTIMKLGEGVEGKKETRNVESYMIAGKSVTQYSAIVFPDESVESVFASAKHNIVDEDGVSNEKVRLASSTAATGKVTA